MHEKSVEKSKSSILIDRKKQEDFSENEEEEDIESSLQ